MQIMISSIHQPVKNAVFYSKVTETVGSHGYNGISIGSSFTSVKYELYDRTGKYLATPKYASKSTIERYMDRTCEIPKILEPIPGVTSYTKMPKKGIFHTKLKKVPSSLIANQYKLHDQYGMTIKKIYATEEEIKQIIDHTCKLRPTKFIIKHYNNNTHVTYVGEHEYVMGVKNFPFLLDDTDPEIFNYDRLDEEWCTDNINKIKFILSPEEKQDTNIHKKSKCNIQ